MTANGQYDYTGYEVPSYVNKPEDRGIHQKIMRWVPGAERTAAFSGLHKS